MAEQPPASRRNTGRSSEYTDQARYGFSVPGDLTTTDNDKILWLPGQDDHVSTATAQVKTAPAVQSINIDIKLILRSTGAVVSTLGTLSIAAGSLTGDLDFTETMVDSFHALAAEITQVGTGTPGSNLTVVVKWGG